MKAALKYFPFVIILLSLSIFGMIDSSVIRNLFIVVALISFIIHPYQYFLLFKKYKFLQHAILVFFLVIIYTIVSYLKGNDVVSIISNALNFLLYPSIFFLIVIFGKQNVYQFHKLVILPLAIFLIVTYFLSKFMIPIYPTFLDAGSGYLRIYFHGYQFSVVCFFLILAILKFQTGNSKSKIFYTLLLTGILLLMFFSFFRAFFILPLIIAVFFFVGSVIKKNRLLFVGLIAFLGVGFIVLNNSRNYKERYLSLLPSNLSNDATTLSRLILFTTKYDFLESKNELLFGNGFMLKKERYDDELIEDRILNPLILDNDNGYANLLITMGFFGMIVFTISYIRVLKQHFSFYKQTNNSFHKAIYYSAFLFGIYTLLVSFVNDFFIWPYALLPVLIINAMVVWSRESDINNFKSNKYV